MFLIIFTYELNNNNNNNGKLQQASQLVLRGWETVEFHP